MDNDKKNDIYELNQNIYKYETSLQPILAPFCPQNLHLIFLDLTIEFRISS